MGLRNHSPCEPLQKDDLMLLRRSDLGSLGARARRRLVETFCLAAAASLGVSTANAQMAPTPGLYDSYRVDNYGADIRTGAYIYSATDAAIGSGQIPRMLQVERSYTSSFLGSYFPTQFDLMLKKCTSISCIQNGGGSVYSFRRGINSVNFTGTATSQGMNVVEVNASTINVYMKDGSWIVFDRQPQSPSCFSTSDIKCFYASAWRWPTGDVIRFKWSSNGYQLVQVSNSVGQVLRYSYDASGNLRTVADLFKESIGSTCLLDNATLCSIPSSSRKVTYSWATLDGVSVLDTVTRPDGSQEKLVFEGYGSSRVFLKSHYVVGHPIPYSNQYTVYSIAGSVSASVTQQSFANSTTRSVTNSANPFTFPAIGETLLTRSYIDRDGLPYNDQITSQNIFTRTDKAGRVYKVYFSGNINPVIDREELPLGNASDYQYDERDNVTIVTRSGVPSSGASNLIEQYFYVEGPAVGFCTNKATCNKIDHYIDARGYQWNNQWDSNGNLLVVEAPADMAGVRPRTSYTYKTVSAADGVLITVLDTETRKISTAVSSITRYYYDAWGRPIGVVADEGGLSLRSCISYDQWDQKISETEPRANLASCP